MKNKLNIDDKVIVKKSPHIFRIITKIMKDGTYVLDNELYDINESEIEKI